MSRFEGLTSREAAEQAIEEHHRMGRSAFLREHSLSAPGHWFIERGGHYIEAEATLARAYQLQHFVPPPASARRGDPSASIESAARRFGLNLVEDPYAITLYTGNTYFRHPDVHWAGMARPFGEYASHIDVIAPSSLSTRDSMSA
jgi:hypothetical protein